MHATDQCGLTITLGADADVSRAANAWNGVLLGFLSHAAATPVHLAETLDAAPRFALAHAVKGLFLLLLGRPELGEAVAAARAAAEAERATLTPRETAYLDALGLYAEGRIAAAADRLDVQLRAAPEDALGFKMVHALRFVIGDGPGMRASAEAAIGAYEGDHPLAGYAKGCLACSQQETRAYVSAEAVGREAVRLAPDDAWGLHAVAHVLDMTGRAEEGVEWLGKRPASWAHCNNFGYHVWWHLALFHLDRGESDEALRLYDAHVRADQTDDYRDISNGASLLMRLEFEGVAVGDRWEELAALSANRTEDGCVVFADLHYLLALGGAGGRAADEARLLRAMKRSAATQRGCQGRAAAEAGAPCAEGLHAFAHGDYVAAFDQLQKAQSKLVTIGGSHAQRDVFDRMTIEAALRAGLLDEAEAEIRARIRRRGARDGYAERRLSRITELKDAAFAAAE